MYKDFDVNLQEIYAGKIHSGITKDKNRYFFFEHSIVNQPSTIRYPDSNTWHSYHIYQITKELFHDISKGNAFNHWDINFNSFYHFGKCFLIVREKVTIPKT